MSNIFYVLMEQASLMKHNNVHVKNILLEFFLQKPLIKYPLAILQNYLI